MDQNPIYMICIKNGEYPASLEFGKVYRILYDEKAERHKMLRVIDESGEDYLYPEDYFVPITLPKAAQDAFAAIQ